METFKYIDLYTMKIYEEEIGSPIEQILYDSLLKNSEKFKDKYKIDRLDIDAQLPIEDGDRTYKVDIWIHLIKVDGLAMKDSLSQGYIIECDGHDFHEKTKEQVKHDKERERNLLNHCSKVIRFSGSEIYNDVDKCCDEIFDIIIHDLHLNTLESRTNENRNADLTVMNLVELLNIIKKIPLDENEAKLVKKISLMNEIQL